LTSHTVDLPGRSLKSVDGTTASGPDYHYITEMGRSCFMISAVRQAIATRNRDPGVVFRHPGVVSLDTAR